MDEARKSGSNVHIPFRQNKLTLALRDSFVDSKEAGSKLIMIGCLSPGNTFTDYSLNTLWYASKLGATKRFVASTYNNGHIGVSSMSLNSSQLVRAKTGLNNSYDQTDKLSLQPITGPSCEYGTKRPSIDNDSANGLSNPKPVKDSQADKMTSNRKTVKSQQQNGRQLGLMKTNSSKRDVKEEPRKNKFIRQIELDKKLEDEKPLMDGKTESAGQEDLFNRYIETLKWESDIIKQESKLISQGVDDPVAVLQKNRKAIVQHIQSKLNMLQKLQQLMADTS
jgi:hypothetical protein